MVFQRSWTRLPLLQQQICLRPRSSLRIVVLKLRVTAWDLVAVLGIFNHEHISRGHISYGNVMSAPTLPIDLHADWNFWFRRQFAFNFLQGYWTFRVNRPG